MRGGHGRGHHHPGGFGGPRPGFFGPGPAVGIWGGGRFCRRGPPPVFGRHGYYYNYSGLVLGTAVLGAAAVGYAGARHNVYVRNRQQVTVVNPPTNVKRYYVDIPADVYPGETFRVVLDGEEVIITCPDVSGPGERIIVCVEVTASPVMVTPAQAPTYQAARIVQYGSAPASASPTAYPAQTPVSPSVPVAVPTATPVNSSNNIANPFGGVSALPSNSGGGGGAATAVPDAVPLSPDVASCPHCTFFNPSVARFCQMCGGALKSA